MVFPTASLKTNVSSTDIIIVLNSALSVLGKVYIYLLKFPFTHVSVTLMFKRRKMTREIVTKHVLLCFYKTNLYLRLRLCVDTFLSNTIGSLSELLKLWKS